MKERPFPNNFLWGVALSAYQVEGNNIHSDWHHWGRQTHLAPCGVSADHYERFEEDLALLDPLHQNAFRFSIEWSRIEPSPQCLDAAVLEHYRKVLQLLKQKGITVFVTLHHFSNPQWFMERGGWKKPENIEYFVNFVNFIVDEFHDVVNYWITFNEPTLYASLAYYEGRFPPGERSFFAFRDVLRNLVRAHRRCFEMVHKKYTHLKMGVATNNQYFEPYSSFWLDRAVVAYTSYSWNHFFLRGIKGRQNFIGLNYYFHNKLKFSFLGDWFNPNHFFSRVKNDNLHVSDQGVEIFPSGMYQVLMDLKKYNLPIYITENGVADSSDHFRKNFIDAHLKNVYIAIKDFCDVRGYFYWSLLDNYEWGSFKPRYGLVKVNFKTLEREIRPSALWYAEVCKKNTIEF